MFEGDDGLGLGPDEEAIAHWLEAGVSPERIVRCPRSENFWQAGPSGPCGPCSELYIDRGVEHGKPEDLPGGENERFLEYWNLVFMQYDQQPTGSDGGSVLEPLPANNIDTGLGLNRMAAILQDKQSVFDTDQFTPLIELGQELSGVRYGEAFHTDRALRILADHTRAMTFLVADGVVPSNEDRGYVLRRVMRRAIQQGIALELDPGFLTSYSQRVREIMGGAYPELAQQAQAIDMWLSAEEESFGHTHRPGHGNAARAHRARARRWQLERARAGGLPPARHVRLPLRDDQRAAGRGGPEDRGRLRGADGAAACTRAGRSQAGSGDGGDTQHARAAASTFAGQSGFDTHFTGYETEEQQTTVGALQSVNGAGAGESGASHYLVKLAESPFYAAGGGQVADVGTIECADGDCRARVQDVFRIGDDQALSVVVEQGVLTQGEPVLARVDRRARHATECNHTATHLLQAALRELVGPHVRQAGSYVGPDKLRFDFSHGQALSAEELSQVEDRVNDWIALNDPVRAITTTLDEARSLGAMALFGEKYGDVVRMVQIGDGHYSRELCGGTHVKRTGEIGPFRILSETSSSANVRRIEALTGPAAVTLLRQHDALLGQIAEQLRTRPQDAAQAVSTLAQERKRLEKALKDGAAAGAPGAGPDLDALVAEAEEIAGANVLTATVQVPDAKALLDVVDRVKGRLPDAAILLGAAADGRVHLVASVAPALVARGVKAGAVVKVAAQAVGGGGGGRDTMAQAGGREPEKLDAAIQAARAEISAALAG